MLTIDNKDNTRFYFLATQITLVVAILIRILALKMPYGIFADEAISAYDSWCLSYFGVDQHLASYPVYLRSWGSGQSALYAYLGIPFIKLFGLSTAVYRLPMAITSCASLLIFYYTIRKTTKNQLYIFTLILFLAISPWHIMKSRWALDCNLAPDFLLISTCFFIIGIYTNNSNKKRFLYYIAGSIFISLTAYSYGVSWFMLPIYCISLFFFLYRKKLINPKQLIACFVLIGIICTPLILFAIQLFTNGEAYQIGPITITTLSVERHSETTILNYSDFWGNLMKVIRYGAIIFIKGDDHLRWNSLPFFGQFYNLITLPFLLFYLYHIYRTRKYNILDMLFFIWLSSCTAIILLVTPNVNHWNLIWFPIIYFVAKGIFIFINQYGRMCHIIVTILLALFIGFSYSYISYFGTDNRQVGYIHGLEEHLKFINQKSFKAIYMKDSFVHSLFYKPISPYEFCKTKKIMNTDSGLEAIHSYSNYRFYLPENINPDSQTAYIISNEDIEKLDIDQKKYKIKRGKIYTLFWNE